MNGDDGHGHDGGAGDDAMNSDEGDGDGAW
jgi:hypothetical protein